MQTRRSFLSLSRSRRALRAPGPVFNGYGSNLTAQRLEVRVSLSHSFSVARSISLILSKLEPNFQSFVASCTSADVSQFRPSVSSFYCPVHSSHMLGSLTVGLQGATTPAATTRTMTITDNTATSINAAATAAAAAIAAQCRHSIPLPRLLQTLLCTSVA